MARHRTHAVTHAVAAVWLAAGVTANAVANDVPAASIGAGATDDGGALFNPFAAASIPFAAASAPRVQARAAEHDLQQGDWALPLLAATAGFAGIGVLMRKMID